MSVSMRRLRRGSDIGSSSRRSSHKTQSQQLMSPEATTAYEPMFPGEDSVGRKLSFSPRTPAQDSSEEAVLNFIRANLGTKAETYAIRFMNKTPFKTDRRYSYILQQGTEEADLLAIEQELTSGRLHRNGLVLQGGAWCRMLLGPRFALGASKKQVHELTYRRSSCTCLVCVVGRAKAELERQKQIEIEAAVAAAAAEVAASASARRAALEKARSRRATLVDAPMSPMSLVSMSSDVSKSKSSGGSHSNTEDPDLSGRLSHGSTSDDDEPRVAFAKARFKEERAMSMPAFRKDISPDPKQIDDFFGSPLPRNARRKTDIMSNRPELPKPTGVPLGLRNQVERLALPSIADLQTCLGAKVIQGELLVGELQRLHSRAAKVKFDGEARPLFADGVYSGPSPPSLLYANVLNEAQNYYRLKRGKKNRRLYIRGRVLHIPIEVGVVKSPRRPLCTSEHGAEYILHARQTMVLYTGTVHFEGDSIGTRVDTRIPAYVGFGPSGGCAAVFPDRRPMGAPRKLGINEILLHHHHEDGDDLIVQCR